MSLILLDKKVSEEEKTKQAVVNGVATGGNPTGAIGAILLSQGRVQVEEEKQKLNQEIVAEKTVSNNLRTANSTLTKELDGDPSATPPIIGFRQQVETMTKELNGDASATPPKPGYIKEVEGDPLAASDAEKVGFRKLLRGDASATPPKPGYIKEVEGDPSANPPIIGFRQQVETMTKELDGDPSANPPTIGLRKEINGDPSATPPIIGFKQKSIDLPTFLKQTELYLDQQPATGDSDECKRVDHVTALFELAIQNKDDAVKLHDIAKAQSNPPLDKLEPILKKIVDRFPS